MLNQIKNFIEGKYFLISISVITFLAWFINIDSLGPQPKFDMLELIFITVFCLVIAFILVNFKETIYTFPLILHSIIMLSNQSLGMDDLNSLWLLYIAIGIVVCAFIYHFIKFKVKLKLGKIGLSLIIFALAYILSLSGYFLDQKPFEFSVIFISLMGVIYFAVYLFYRSTNDKDFRPFLFRSFYYLSFVVILQTIVMIIFFFIDNSHLGSFTDILNHAIDHRWIYDKNGVVVRLSVGWGVGNNIAGLLAMLLPVHMYYIFTSRGLKQKVVYFILMMVSLLTIAITTSRGAYLGVLGFGVIFILAVIFYAKIDYKQYKNPLIIGGICLAIIGIVVGIFMFDFMKSLLANNSFLNGRETDWVDAIKYYLEYPLFGKSWYSDVWESNSFRSYHNTILHTMATMGTFGLLAFIYYHVELVRLFIKKWSFETLVVVGMLVVVHVHGLVDNTFYSPLQAFPLIVLYIAVENQLDKEPVINQKLSIKKS